MKTRNFTKISFFIVLLGALLSFALFNTESDFVTYIANPKTQYIKLYWKNDQSQNFKSIQNLKFWLGKKEPEARVCHKCRNVQKRQFSTRFVH